MTVMISAGFPPRAEQTGKHHELDRRQEQDAAGQLADRQGQRSHRQRLEGVHVIDVAAERPGKLHGEDETSSTP